MSDSVRPDRPSAIWKIVVAKKYVDDANTDVAECFDYSCSLNVSGPVLSRQLHGSQRDHFMRAQEEVDNSSFAFSEV